MQPYQKFTAKNPLVFYWCYIIMNCYPLWLSSYKIFTTDKEMSEYLIFYIIE